RARLYRVVVEYEIEKLVTAALPVAVRIVETLVRGEIPDIQRDMAELTRITNRHGLGPSTRAIIDAAREREIPCLRVTEDANLFQLGWGHAQKRIQATITSDTSFIATDIASDKALTKRLLAEAGLPV